MVVVRLYIENIRDLDNISADIEKLGKITGLRFIELNYNMGLPSGARHYKMGIKSKSEYIEVMGPVFCNTVRPLLVFNYLWTLQLEEVVIVCL